MRILVLLSAFFASGQTTHVVSLTQTLQQMGHQVHLLLTRPRSRTSLTDRYLDQLERVGVQVHLLPNPQSLIAIAQSISPQIVHAHSSQDFPLAYQIWKQAKIPYVITCHGLGLDHPRYRRALHGAGRLICVGPKIAAHIDRFRSRIVIIQNGVDTQVFFPSPHQGFNILYSGRMDQFKEAGFQALMTAIDQLSHPFTLYVASNKKILPYLPPKAQYLGWVDEIQKYTNQADLVIGTGRSIREGMAAGAVGMLLGYSYDGLVRPAQLEGFPDFSGRMNHPTPPDPQEIMADLTSLLEDPELLTSLKQESRAYALIHFDLQAIAQGTLDLYQQVIENPPETHRTVVRRRSLHASALGARLLHR